MEEQVELEEEVGGASTEEEKRVDNTGDGC